MKVNFIEFCNQIKIVTLFLPTYHNVPYHFYDFCHMISFLYTHRVFVPMIDANSTLNAHTDQNLQKNMLKTSA